MSVQYKRLLAMTLVVFAIVACEAPRESDRTAVNTEVFESTYQAMPSEPVFFRNATILTGDGERIDGGSILVSDGTIVAVGADVEAPDDVLVVDVGGKWITPGIIDVHSHLGVYPSPDVPALADGNEISAPNTAEVWAEHSIWPQDPGFATALAGGVTTMQILPGSANLFGGRSVTVKNVPARTYQAMKFPGAPHGLKMACGENPKRVYGAKGVAPTTRMGNVAGYRSAWAAAQKYSRDWERYENGEAEEEPERNLQLETLAGVLKGEILVHNHCYRADEMATMLDIAKEFGYRVTAFHHAVEAYKVADLLAENDTCAAMWADWWGFKIEAYDGVRENIPMVDAAGACAIVHSDSEIGMQRLNQEAAKAMAAANRIGFDIDEAQAIRWLTSNPAKALGIGDDTGTLSAGRMADLVVWSGNPFSVYTKADKVFIDGALVYDREDPARQPQSDFELGQL
ncbi:MAG: amidohydrolase [Gammaproteobacteria bacterium]